MKQILFIAAAILLAAQSNAQIGFKKTKKEPTATEILQHVKAGEAPASTEGPAPLYTAEETQALLEQIKTAKEISDLPVIKTRLTALTADVYKLGGFTDEITDEVYTGWEKVKTLNRDEVFEVHGIYTLPVPINEKGKISFDKITQRQKRYSTVAITPGGLNGNTLFLQQGFDNAFLYGTESGLWDAYTHRFNVILARKEYQQNQ